MDTDHVTGTGDDLPCCDMPQMWGGAAWVPHTDEYHQRWRETYLRVIRRRLVRRIATLAGHQVTIRFTASIAFFDCTCLMSGPLRPDSGSARIDGQEHLYRAGEAVLRRVQLCSWDENGEVWACGGSQDPDLYCDGLGFLWDWGADFDRGAVCTCPCGHGEEQ